MGLKGKMGVLKGVRIGGLYRERHGDWRRRMRGGVIRVSMCRRERTCEIVRERSPVKGLRGG